MLGKNRNRNKLENKLELRGSQALIPTDAGKVMG